MSETIALYRKYRPQDFGSLVGQEHVVQTLLNASKKDSFSHAYLFSGPRGTGKTSTARIVAKAINCPKKKDGEPCNSCPECSDIQAGNHPDLIELDAASHTSVEDVRDLIEKAQFAPSRGKKKIYIIDEAHMLSKSAFNALLKTLEEPPSHVHFILATTEPHKLPITIISRCQRFDFRRITEQDITNRLQYICKEEKIKAEPEALALIAKQTQGGLRDSIGLLEQLKDEDSLTLEKVQDNLGLTSLPILESLFAAIEQQDTSTALEIINQTTEKGANLSQFIRDFLELVRQKMLIAVKQKSAVSHYLNIITAFRTAAVEHKQSIIPQLPLEIACIKSTSVTLLAPAPAAQPHSTAPSVASAPAPAAQPQPKAAQPVSSNLPFWQEIQKQIKTPALKITLKDTAAEQKDNKLIIATGSNFNLEKLSQPSSKAEIQKAAHAVLDQTLEIEIIKQDLPLKEVSPQAKEDNLLDHVSDIFNV